MLRKWEQENRWNWHRHFPLTCRRMCTLSEHLRASAPSPHVRAHPCCRCLLSAKKGRPLVWTKMWGARSRRRRSFSLAHTEYWKNSRHSPLWRVLKEQGGSRHSPHSWLSNLYQWHFKRLQIKSRRGDLSKKRKKSKSIFLFRPKNRTGSWVLSG